MRRTCTAVVVALALAVGLVLGLATHGSSGNAATAPPVLPAALAIQSQFVNVVQRVVPSVVLIESEDGLGSGVIFDDAGHIVTNAHVVGSSTRFKVTFANGKRANATLRGAFIPDDIAVITVPTRGLRPITVASSSRLRVGDLVLAVGNPLGLRSSVTDGIISALGRTVNEPSGTALPNAIQTSAAINSGNSGGALVDISGRLVGIPTLAATNQLGQTSGIGFAIPSDLVRDIAGQIIRNGKVTNSRRAYLGVQVGDLVGVTGAYLGEVAPGSPAAKAGIQEGDIILSIAGKRIADSDAVSSTLAGLRPGQTVNVVVRRPGGGTATRRVTLGRYPGS